MFAHNYAIPNVIICSDSSNDLNQRIKTISFLRKGMNITLVAAVCGARGEKCFLSYFKITHPITAKLCCSEIANFTSYTRRIARLKGGFILVVTQKQQLKWASLLSSRSATGMMIGLRNVEMMLIETAPLSQPLASCVCLSRIINVLDWLLCACVRACLSVRPRICLLKNPSHPSSYSDVNTEPCRKIKKLYSLYQKDLSSEFPSQRLSFH